MRATWDSGAETWIVFYGSCEKKYRAFEVLLASLPLPAPRATGSVQQGSPLPPGPAMVGSCPSHKRQILIRAQWGRWEGRGVMH